MHHLFFRFLESTTDDSKRILPLLVLDLHMAAASSFTRSYHQATANRMGGWVCCPAVLSRLFLVVGGEARSQASGVGFGTPLVCPPHGQVRVPPPPGSRAQQQKPE